MNDRAFSLSFFRVFTHYESLVTFRSLNFSCKINRINPLVVIISSKLPAITKVMHKLLWVLQTIPNDNSNRIQVTIRSLAVTYANCLSRVLDVPAPTPVTTSDRCYVPHLLVGSAAVQC